jgi:LysM repeat protein
MIGLFRANVCGKGDNQTLGGRKVPLRCPLTTTFSDNSDVQGSSSRGIAMASYTIKPGDSLSQIAANNGISLQQLLDANKAQNLQVNSTIYAGNSLNLPDTNSVFRAPAAQRAPVEPSPRATVAEPTISLLTATYTVRAGDTWAFIAQKEGVSLADLKRANPQISRSDRLPARTILNLPTHADSTPPQLLARPSLPPQYNQYDERWGNDRMGGGDSLRKSGCAVASLASGLAVNNILIDGELANPKTLNAWLNRNKGYSGNLLIWASVEKLTPTLQFVGMRWFTAKLLLQRELDEGLIVVAHVRQDTHFVLLTGHNGKGLYTCMDPGFHAVTCRHAEISTTCVYRNSSFDSDMG